MRRRPLLRGAAIAGGAYYAGMLRMQAKQRDRKLKERSELLGRLIKLHEAGVLTDDEFATQREGLGDQGLTHSQAARHRDSTTGG